MDMQFAVDVARMALWNALLIALPPLLAGMIVGLFISVLQTATSIQEQTMTFVPKIVGLILVMIFFGPWIIQRLMTFTVQLWGKLVEVGAM